MPGAPYYKGFQAFYHCLGTLSRPDPYGWLILSLWLRRLRTVAAVQKYMPSCWERSSPGSIQKKFMDRAHLSGNSSKKLQINMQKVSIWKKLCPQTPEILKSEVSEDDFSV